MSRRIMPHPAEDELLRFADGELPLRKAAGIRAHLEACWQCRAALEDFKNVVSECVRYRKNVLESHLPSPPAPWGDLQRGFDQIDAAAAGRSFFSSVTATLRRSLARPRRWAPAMVAAILIAAILHQLADTPSVRAAGLLRKAVTAADSRPPAPRRIQIRTSRHRITRTIAPNTAPQPATAQTDLSSVRDLFQTARYNWDDPLSARSFQSWRNNLADRRDEVASLGGRYRIRTTTNSGSLAEATLLLDTADLHPVESTLHFRNQEWVEIKELAAEPAAPEPAPAIAAASPPASPAPPPVEPAAAGATVAHELQAFAALHAIGADLGDPIEVSRDSRRVFVSGVGLDPGRKREIQRALSSVPNVQLRFSDAAAAAPVPETRARPEPSADPPPPPLQSQLERYVGSGAALERFVAHALDLSDTMMARAYALRTLAQRFPETVEAEMSAPDLRLLASLQQSHAVALARHSADLRRTLDPLLASLGDSPAAAAPPSLNTASWQKATPDLFRSAREAETLLAALLGGAPTATSSGRLPVELSAAIGRLCANSEAYSALTPRPASPKD
jgi:hypothetical protein